jgi:cholesterol transport system auxiliary component
MATAFALTACGPLVQIGGNAKAPESLLTLTATAAPAAPRGPVASTATIAVEVPAVPAALQTLRLPVTTSATEVTYLAGASWAEQPARQFQRVLSDTLAASGQPVVDLRQGTITPARTLTGTLREFGLDVRDPAAPVARVRYDAQIAAPRAAEVALRRFETTEPVASLAPVVVAAALNRASNRIAAEVADWSRK